MRAVDFSQCIRLDSSLPNAKWSHARSQPAMWLTCDSRTLHSTLRANGGRVIQEWADPLAALAWMSHMAEIPDPEARWIGYLSYDLGRLFEHLPVLAAEDLGLPLFSFTMHYAFSDPAAYVLRPASQRA